MSLPTAVLASWMLEQEARALLTRLARVKPLGLVESMVPAAGISPAAQTGIDRFLMRGRRELRQHVHEFLAWLRTPAARRAPAAEGQRRLAVVRMMFNTALGQFDLFADALTQRSEQDTGVWLAGLDAVAADALALPPYYASPPVVCYLDRGVGAAIRRARTRLPGGGENPVAIIRVPRERMVGSGIASSLVHEVGHQAAALLDLVNSLQPVLRGLQSTSSTERIAWGLWERWVSEIVADFWGVARLGIASTLGLMSVVSLPRAFVLRVSLDDPHPVPWVRVKLSCAIGSALYPDPQWDQLARIWEALYPLGRPSSQRRELFRVLDATTPAFVQILVNHRPRALRGRSLGEVVAMTNGQPAQLIAHYRRWHAAPALARSTPPTLAFAVIGQARAHGSITPEAESRLLADLLTFWALQRNLSVSDVCARGMTAGVARAI